MQKHLGKPDWKRRLKTKLIEFRNDFTDKFLALLFFGFAGLCFWVLIQMVYMFYGFSIVEWIKDLPYLYGTFSYLVTEIRSGTPTGIFYLFSISSLFFLPVPLEALYFKYLREGIEFETIFLLAVGGIMVGQLINYFLGRFFWFMFIQFIKKRTRKSMKKKLSKHGTWAVLSVHLIPFPFQIFNFISGILKYGFFKWLFFAVTGLAIKHYAMYWIYIKFF